MIETPEIVRTEAQLTAIIRLKVPREEIRNVMGPSIAEVIAAIEDQRVVPAGPVFSHHLKLDPKTFDFEVGVPVNEPIAKAGRVKAGRRLAATVARTTYRGPYEGLGPAWAEFDAWIAAQGHKPADDLWECYVTGPESDTDPTTFCTELNRPLLEVVEA